MQHNIAVLYKSKYGSAERIARMIALKTHADLFEITKIKSGDLARYDTVVYGGALYAEGMLGMPRFKNIFKRFPGKNYIIFSVGVSPARPEALEDIAKNNFTEEMRTKASIFHLRGAFDYNKLNWLHKYMMQLLKRRITKKKGGLNGDERGMLAAISAPVDFISEKSVLPVVDCILNYKSGMEEKI